MMPVAPPLGYGASGGNRTPNPLITNQELYQLSYAGPVYIKVGNDNPLCFTQLLSSQFHSWGRIWW